MTLNIISSAADAKRQRQQRCDSEAGALAHDPARVRQVAGEIVEHGESPCFARVLVNQGQIPETASRCFARFFERHAARQVILNLQLQMGV